jgi:hypothetical protein
MFSLIFEGVLQGFGAMLAVLWEYSVAHPWVWIFVLAAVGLKILEVRLRRRRPRRR